MFTVPAGVSSVQVMALGAPGASGGGAGPAGRGAVVNAPVSVTPGQVLYVEVGGAPTAGGANVCVSGISCVGGFNGGGSSRFGGGGGGASDVRTVARSDPTGTLASRLLVAAGGGGGGLPGEDCSGAAGGDAGAAGATGCQSGGTGGGAGTSSAGGAGGAPSGQAGDLGIGGQGGGFTGGGGGGGLYGGGGGGDVVGDNGGAGGGGGGSNLVPAGGTSMLRNFRPQVSITYASVSEQHAALLASATGVGPGKSLANKARQSQVAAAADNEAGACATLAAFIREVSAQRGRKLTAAQAASLITQAENIRATLAC
jgi:hypothetical protein